jgi:hypothetical protein
MEPSLWGALAAPPWLAHAFNREAKAMTGRNGHHLDTILEHTGRDPAKNFGIVNPPVYHASTVIFPTLKALLETRADRASGAFEGITLVAKELRRPAHSKRQ